MPLFVIQIGRGQITRDVPGFDYVLVVGHFVVLRAVGTRCLAASQDQIMRSVPRAVAIGLSLSATSIITSNDPVATALGTDLVNHSLNCMRRAGGRYSVCSSSSGSGVVREGSEYCNLYSFQYK